MSITLMPMANIRMVADKWCSRMTMTQRATAARGCKFLDLATEFKAVCLLLRAPCLL